MTTINLHRLCRVTEEAWNLLAWIFKVSGCWVSGMLNSPYAGSWESVDSWISPCPTDLQTKPDAQPDSMQNSLHPYSPWLLGYLLLRILIRWRQTASSHSMGGQTLSLKEDWWEKSNDERRDWWENWQSSRKTRKLQQHPHWFGEPVQNSWLNSSESTLLLHGPHGNIENNVSDTRVPITEMPPSFTI